MTIRRRVGSDCLNTAYLASFTLVELLVAVSIIVLLIAILIPSLQRARAGARSMKCLANLRAQAVGCAVYAADDRNENVVPVHPRIVGWRVWGAQHQPGGTAEWGGRSGAGGPYNDSTDPVATSYWGTANGMGPGTRPLNSTIYKGGLRDYGNEPGSDQINWRNDAELDLEVYHCPSDVGYTGYYHPLWRDSGLPAFEHFGNSYQVPPLHGGWSGRFWCARSIGAFLHATSRIPNPSNSLLFGDAPGTYAHFVGGFVHYVECVDLLHFEFLALSEPNRGWHGRDWLFNFAYTDAHAEPTRIYEVYGPAPQLPYYPISRISGNPNSYEDWKCLIWRGPGWQVDVLPAIPVNWGREDGGPNDDCDGV